MHKLKQKKIILSICGGIAAYKAAELARELTQLGALVQVVMTENAHAFITPMTLQALTGNIVRSELFDVNAERAMGHIELARWADYIIIAPASANCIAKLAHGMADDLLSTLCLVAEIPIFICPAMNRSMWEHVATQTNVRKLIRRNITIIGPDTGLQACGEIGLGRLSETQNIINALYLYTLRDLLQGKKVIITAGPTRENIDPVRYISNHSSGKMGYALAAAAMYAGAHVTLITGPTSLPPPQVTTIIHVYNAQEMFDAVMHAAVDTDIFIATAAVADYTPHTPTPAKIKKHLNATEISLTLKQNPDILATVTARKLARYTIGFAAETTDLLYNARQKFIHKQPNMLIANIVGPNLGFDQDQNQCIVLTKQQETVIPLMPKIELAGKLIELIIKDMHATND